MNYLAHAYLGDRSDAFLIGSFMGDFVKGTPGNRFSPQVVQGIVFHRKVDSYADNHGLTLASRNLFSGRRRRYAGVILDICYDHFLAKHWQTYSNETLSVFIARVYALLQRHHDILPERLKSVIPRMRAQDWLSCYRTLAGVAITLERMSNRLRHKDSFKGAAEEINRHYAELEKNFFDFFPDLVQYARNYVTDI
jgi:acyl carrier protein phosphodiesterase